MREEIRFTLSALVWALILLAVYAIAVHAQTGATHNQYTRLIEMALTAANGDQLELK